VVNKLPTRIVYALALIGITAGIAGAQTRAMLPYDHIHLNEPAAEASVWWEKNIPGGRRITEAPNRIMYGAVRLMFLGARSSGGSQGSVIEHLGFSVADIDAKMRELAAIDTKVIEPVKSVPGLYRTALIETPWGTRVQLVQDPELLGLHHVQLRVTDPETAYTWLLDKFGGERTKIFDFGICAVGRRGATSGEPPLETMIGTPVYMSPEQCAGAAHADPRSDIYGLGCVLYQMLTGSAPFERDSVRVYIPLASMLVTSIALTLLLGFLRRSF